MATSNGVAVASDQGILMAIRNEERIAERDREVARELNSGRIPMAASRNPNRSAHGDADYDHDDAISAVMGDLMERMTVSDTASNAAGPSRWASARASASTSRSPWTECVSCYEKVNTREVFTSSCGHAFCRACTRQLFLGGIRDEELYPPRCCGNIIPPGIAMRFLDFQELKDFSERAIEYGAKDRLYCADVSCSKFIPPFSVHGEYGQCRRCNQETHLPCRALAHPGVDCPMDTELQNVLAIANEESWTRCYNCRTMVELTVGCNHMRCR